MVYGDAGGATAFLVGEENKGLACMFTMMNNARLAVGLQGVALAERATQQALAYARERRQGRGESGEAAPIVEHPDVARMVLDHDRADPGRAGDLLRNGCFARPRQARGRSGGGVAGAGAGGPADAGRQGLFHRHRQ